MHFVSSQGAWQSHGPSQMHSRYSCGFSRIMGSPWPPVGQGQEQGQEQAQGKGQGRDRARTLPLGCCWHWELCTSPNEPFQQSLRIYTKLLLPSRCSELTRRNFQSKPSGKGNSKALVSHPPPLLCPIPGSPAPKVMGRAGVGRTMGAIRASL